MILTIITYSLLAVVMVAIGALLYMVAVHPSRQIKAIWDTERTTYQTSYDKRFDDLNSTIISIRLRYDQRIDELESALSIVEQRYIELAQDYTLLKERAQQQAAHIQSVTVIMLERDLFKRNAEALTLKIETLEARIQCMEAQIKGRQPDAPT